MKFGKLVIIFKFWYKFLVFCHQNQMSLFLIIIMAIEKTGIKATTIRFKQGIGVFQISYENRNTWNGHCFLLLFHSSRIRIFTTFSVQCESLNAWLNHTSILVWSFHKLIWLFCLCDMTCKFRIYIKWLDSPLSRMRNNCNIPWCCISRWLSCCHLLREIKSAGSISGCFHFCWMA